MIQDVRLFVQQECKGVSTCLVLLRGTRLAKTGDYMVLVDTHDWIRLGDFMIDAYTSELPASWLVTRINGNGPAGEEWWLTPKQKQDRDKITSYLWKKFCVPVMEGGVLV